MCIGVVIYDLCFDSSSPSVSFFFPSPPVVITLGPPLGKILARSWQDKDARLQSVQRARGHRAGVCHRALSDLRACSKTVAVPCEVEICGDVNMDAARLQHYLYFSANKFAAGEGGRSVRDW